MARPEKAHSWSEGAPAEIYQRAFDGVLYAPVSNGVFIVVGVRGRHVRILCKERSMAKSHLLYATQGYTRYTLSPLVIDSLFCPCVVNRAFRGTSGCKCSVTTTYKKQKMRGAGVEPSTTSYTTAINACAGTADWKKALLLLVEMREAFPSQPLLRYPMERKPLVFKTATERVNKSPREDATRVRESIRERHGVYETLFVSSKASRDESSRDDHGKIGVNRRRRNVRARSAEAVVAEEGPKMTCKSNGGSGYDVKGVRGDRDDIGTMSRDNARVRP